MAENFAGVPRINEGLGDPYFEAQVNNEFEQYLASRVDDSYCIQTNCDDYL